MSLYFELIGSAVVTARTTNPLVTPVTYETPIPKSETTLNDGNATMIPLSMVTAAAARTSGTPTPMLSGTN